MHRVAVAVLWLSLLPGLAAAGSPAPELAAVYPNPVADGDAGEFVVIEIPETSDTRNYTLSDGEGTVPLPNDTGRVVLAFETARPATLDGETPVVHEGGLQLANAGERLVLRHNGTTVDALRYENARKGIVLESASDGLRSRPLGATERPIVDAGAGRIRAFVLPDAGGLPVEVLRGADYRLLLAGYTLTSYPLTDALIDAQQRGVEVRVLVEGGPVGGMARPQVDRLDRLREAGIDVRVLGGPRARYRFHHPKYAVVDDRALVTTENWKPAGVGGRASRGWGAVTGQSAVVDGLVATFRADAGWRDAIPWERYRDSVEPTNASVANGRYPRRFAPAAVPVNETRLLVAPDNAERAVLALLDNATESIWIQQPSIGGPNQPFVAASLDAARRGVSVRLFLGSAWYNEEGNRLIAERLRAVATREGLDLEVALASPRGRFDRLHAKGVVVDGDRVLLGSLNWNNNSARRNREVALLLAGDAVGAYYERVVRSDWSAGRRRLLVGLAVAVGVVAVAAVAVGRKISFQSGDPPAVGP